MNDIVNWLLLLLFMIFAHIIDDYFLQNILAKLKQKKYWEDEVKDFNHSIYQYDYIPALICHAFEWSTMIMIPVFIYNHFLLDDKYIIKLLIILCISANTIFHAIIDNHKANLFTINLWQDQLLHLLQILLTWIAIIFNM